MSNRELFLLLNTPNCPEACKWYAAAQTSRQAAPVKNTWGQRFLLSLGDSIILLGQALKRRATHGTKMATSIR